jgi:hypothetical protein
VGHEKDKEGKFLPWCVKTILIPVSYAKYLSFMPSLCQWPCNEFPTCSTLALFLLLSWCQRLIKPWVSSMLSVHHTTKLHSSPCYCLMLRKIPEVYLARSHGPSIYYLSYFELTHPRPRWLWFLISVMLRSVSASLYTTESSKPITFSATSSQLIQEHLSGPFGPIIWSLSIIVWP